ncbi:hypothetical protein HYFRA_00007995 [Hymenoscyphus fraxineus]|uniref:Uncharacterized protein n=1 Tax=Hymenoscyphus fraxineus TaxID=746836 RepID=A0A9N9PR91_9HELO|nr:hypothetical protein HYFRA_00007995 [Hymenoscyphus fraxineus]
MFVGQLSSQFERQQSTQRNTKPISRPEELRKQWKDISTTQKNLLHAHTTHLSTHDASNQILSQTFDSCNNLVPIYRKDILQLLDDQKTHPITIEPVEKYIFMICRHANQYYGGSPVNPPYCVALYSEFLSLIEQERYSEASQFLISTGVHPTQFFKTRFILIPFVLGVNGGAFPGLLVISRFHRTIDILDPSANSTSSSKFPNDSVPNILAKVFMLIYTHANGQFNPLEWRMRWTAASQQALDTKSAYVAVMANAMSIAFGHEIHNWLDISLCYSDNFRESISSDLTIEIGSKPYQHKASRAALELLHGKFEKFDQTREDNHESGAYAYSFGDSDYMNPDPVYRFIGDQLVEMKPEFTRLPDLRELYLAVLGKSSVPQIGIVKDHERGSPEDRGFRRMLICNGLLAKEQL